MGKCRCGHDEHDQSEHPCHGGAYTCRKPATQRFYNAEAVCLAGMQMKFQMTSTWACEECWKEFGSLLKRKGYS